MGGSSYDRPVYSTEDGEDYSRKSATTKYCKSKI